ncbi:MAG TPA: adenylate/guanylate cyclase domain-containing protein [Nitrososphaeraceae archaeon]|nr:adenylate/guanylate cyclase domain-containing protein [Nitrososphaeraceae archaeon]
MTTGKYFNRGVMALDSPYIGHVVRETFDKIVVFGEGNDRYDIPKSEIQTTGRNVLIGLNFYEIAKRYKVNRQEPLPTTVPLEHWTQGKNIDLASYERKYPKGLFNKGVRVLNEDHVGHVMKEIGDKVVIFGDYNYRFDVPKSRIKEVGRNVILNMDFSELASKYKIDRNAPLPTGEPIEKINDEAYPEAYYHYKGIREEKRREKHQPKKTTRKPRLVSRKVEGDKENDDGGKKDNITARSIANMIMGGNNADNTYSKNRIPSSSAIAPLEIVDAQTLVTRTQDRMWKALEGRYLYDSSLKDSQAFLFNHVSSKIPLVIMYADLVGSTNMSMTLPVDKMVTIIRAFTYEMTCIVRSYGGYVLKYVGDAIIAFFPSGYNKLLACDKAVQCANSMITVIKKGINPILKQYDYPELYVKIGIDEGENVIVQYGHDKSSFIDILGYCMSITSKMTSLTGPDKITVGKDVYDILHPEIKGKFTEIKHNIEDWKYTDRRTGELYKLYTLQN